MENVNYFLSITITVLLWLQAAIVLVSSGAIAVGYYRIGYRHYQHIVPIAASHCIFTVLAVTAIEWELYPLISWRGGFVFLAFVLSDYGLGKIFAVAAPKIFPNYFTREWQRGNDD